MLGSLKDLFQKKIKAEPTIPFSEGDLQESISINRNSLSLVDNWIDDAAFKNSWFSYGVPDFIKKEINRPLNSDITYTDIMLFIAKRFFKELNYLEIGVSVGKNFFQLLNAYDHANFAGFDIEEINPVIEKKLLFNFKEEWQTPAKSIKKNNSSLKTYSFQNSTVKYLCADVWDENSWAKLKNSKFNMVFSDALHSPEAILFEFEMLAKYNLLDEQFVIVWDDLVGKMKKSFYKIIRKYNEAYKLEGIYLLNDNGWVGQYEIPHSVGIISNFSLR